ncbi:MAG: hypothetical protein NXI27_20490 [Alphaproteobacteria bacterium]|nr:hypothetical protein [Alphaproteobacteria bacterium]
MFRPLLGLSLLFLCVVGSFPSFAAKLQVLARPGPWPVADRLIVYRNKVWFSTAVKGVDHNSADIWSFDPSTRKLHFERYLFSQDTGHPVVHGGLLYWPHEDMRIGLGAGIVSVTNGQDWRDLAIPSGDHMMHTHAIAEWKGDLVAAMAGWNSVLALSQDAGRRWRPLVNDAPKSGAFHRYNDIAALGDRLFVRHWQTTGLSLAEYRDGKVVPVEGWPDNSSFSGFTRFGEALYVLLDREGRKTELWRIDGEGPARVDVEPADLTMRQLVSDNDRLWIVAGTNDGGQLWSSADSSVFTPGDRFHGGISHSAVAVAPGSIYVAGEGIDGRSILWGPPAQAITKPASPPPLPQQAAEPETNFDAVVEKERIARILENVESYQSHGRPLREALQAALEEGPGLGFFTSLLAVPAPQQEIEIFGGRTTVSAPEMAKWHILAAMARNGEKSVPTGYLSAAWSRPSNRPQKWFDPLLISIYAIQVTGQDDRATVNALIDRLDQPTDPDWLTSQVTGTLTAITGKPFAYDSAAWKAWWISAKSAWRARPGIRNAAD